MVKMKIKQIGNAVWELEKEGAMKVPALIFGTIPIMEKMKNDRTLLQLQNVASLDGIINYAMVMPDGHEGYGFPIGGVAAFDAEEGIVSPGGIGYDINCTDAETKILLEHGVYVRIKEIEESIGVHKTKFTDFEDFSVKNANILFFMKRHEKQVIYEIKTKTGKLLKVTSDHPIYTKEGMKKADRVSTNDFVAVCGYEGIQYKKPNNEIIVDEKTILETFSSQRKVLLGRNALLQILNYLKKSNILPIRHSSPQLPYLTKILGYAFGDCSISFVNGKKGVVRFCGKEKNLEKIRKDIIKIGFIPSKICKRLRKRAISTHYKKHEFMHIEHSFIVTSSAFAYLLVALGAPVGLKTIQQYLLPKWLFTTPLWIKRLFLAAFFGAEMSAPATINKYNFYAPTLGMNKLEIFEMNAVNFLSQIKELLKEFEIETSPIAKVCRYGANSKYGYTCNFRVQILSKSENLLKFFENVSFEYHEEKFKNACLAINYIRLKERIKNECAKVRQIAIALYANGNHTKEIYTKLANQYSPDQFVRCSFWTKFKKGPRITFNFMSFSEYKDNYALGDSGLAFDRIEEIKKVPFDDYVYDITIENENHNFIANGFIVSNCGVRLVRTGLTTEQIKPKIKQLTDKLFTNIPSGVGSEGKIRLSHAELDKVARLGTEWAIESNYGWEEDAERTEEYGRIDSADESKVTPTAKARGKSQLGTLGAGNHFLEIQKIEKIVHESAAKSFGLAENEVVIMIHCGSRGYGHQICTDQLGSMLNLANKTNLWLTDRELVYAPIKTQEAQDYLAAMKCAVNFAFANRQIIMHWVRQTFDEIIGKGTSDNMNLIYDVAHNIAKIEEHEVNKQRRKLIVHRKGATRAFPAGRIELPPIYRNVGQPVIIPGSMGTASYVLIGNKKGLKISWGSTCHGSGRVMSRGEAIRTHDSNKIVKDLAEKQQIYIRATDKKVISEEAPDAYKNVDEVVESVASAGISDIVAKLKPLAVVKG